jgi:hypothetical protein
MPFSPPSHPVRAVCRATSPCQWRLGGLRAGRLPLPALPVAGQSGTAPALLVAGQSGTGDPRLREPHKTHRFAGTP